MPTLTCAGRGSFRAAYAVTASLFLAVVLLGEGPIQRLLRRPSLVTIGKLSYGMYLVQSLAIRGAESVARLAPGQFLVSTSALLLAWSLSVASAQLLAVTIESAASGSDDASRTPSYGNRLRDARVVAQGDRSLTATGRPHWRRTR